jgi:predicted glutamine amidotransferase
MCRWIAYCGEPIALEQYVTEPAHSLLSQSLNALESAASTNGDGFGLGWYGEQAEPGLFRDLRPAWSDENLRHLCRHIRSRLFFAHVRAATGTAITRANCHPFASREWMFMHNGFIGDWHRLRREVESMIPDELYAEREGTTDSEAVFLAMMGAGIATSPVPATARVLTTLSEMVTRSGTKERLRFTAALADGQNLYAFRYALNDSANSLYYRAVGEGVVIVSEPLDRETASWKPVPENSALVARAGQPIKIEPLFQPRKAVA